MVDITRGPRRDGEPPETAAATRCVYSEKYRKGGFFSSTQVVVTGEQFIVDVSGQKKFLVKATESENGTTRDVRFKITPEGEEVDLSLAEMELLAVLSGEKIIDTINGTVVGNDTTLPPGDQISFTNDKASFSKPEIDIAWEAARRTAFYYETDGILNQIAEISHPEQPTVAKQLLRERIFEVLNGVSADIPPAEAPKGTALAAAGQNTDGSVRVVVSVNLLPGEMSLYQVLTSSKGCEISLIGKDNKLQTSNNQIANLIVLGALFQDLDAQEVAQLSTNLALRDGQNAAIAIATLPKTHFSKDQASMPVVAQALQDKAVMYVSNGDITKARFYVLRQKIETNGRRWGLGSKNNKTMLSWYEIIENPQNPKGSDKSKPAVTYVEISEPETVSLLYQARTSQFPIIW